MFTRFLFTAEERLGSILKAMKNQHMRNQIKTVKKEEITADDLKALKHDVSGLKFELLSYIKHLPRMFSQFEARHNFVYTLRGPCTPVYSVFVVMKAA